MSNLLYVTRFPADSKKISLMLEMEVNANTAPFLVTSSKGVVWVQEAMAPTPEMWAERMPEHVVRVAVRPDVVGHAGALFLEVIDAVEALGREAQWGNSHPFTEDGIRAATEHVKSYDLGDLCLLHAREDTTLSVKAIAKDMGLLPQPCSWMPEGCAVVAPKDRTFLGVLGLLGRGGSVAVVHNASRAMAIARGSSA